MEQSADDKITPAALLKFMQGTRLYALDNPADTEDMPYTGENKRQLLVLFTDAEQEQMSDMDQALLYKILKAVAVEPEDIALVNMALAGKVHFKRLKNRFGAKKLLAFGIQPESLSLQTELPLYRVSGLYGCRLLFAASLDALGADDRAKRQLWTALQHLFDISE